MVRVPQLWPGATVACVASGPSLCAEDTAALRGVVRVIAVNDAVQLAPWADVLYSSDRGWWQRFQRGATPFPGLKFSIGSRLGGRDRVPRCPDVTVLQNTGDAGLESSPHGLRTGRNSGAAAIGLAVHLGARRVLLLGYDMAWSKGRAHFFDDQPPIKSPYRTFLQMFATMVAPLHELGVDVINCTRGGALEVFPRASLAHALSAREVAA